MYIIKTLLCLYKTFFIARPFRDYVLFFLGFLIKQIQEKEVLTSCPPEKGYLY